MRWRDLWGARVDQNQGVAWQDEAGPWMVTTHGIWIWMTMRMCYTLRHITLCCCSACLHGGSDALCSEVLCCAMSCVCVPQQETRQLLVQVIAADAQAALAAAAAAVQRPKGAEDVEDVDTSGV